MSPLQLVVSAAPPVGLVDVTELPSMELPGEITTRGATGDVVCGSMGGRPRVLIARAHQVTCLTLDQVISGDAIVAGYVLGTFWHC